MCRRVKVGDKIRIISMAGEPDQAGKEGYVEYIDDAGHLHGTWSGLAIIPAEDDYEIIGESKDVRLVE